MIKVNFNPEIDKAKTEEILKEIAPAVAQEGPANFAR